MTGEGTITLVYSVQRSLYRVGCFPSCERKGMKILSLTGRVVLVFRLSLNKV